MLIFLDILSRSKSKFSSCHSFAPLLRQIGQFSVSFIIPPHAPYSLVFPAPISRTLFLRLALAASPTREKDPNSAPPTKKEFLLSSAFLQPKSAANHQALASRRVLTTSCLRICSNPSHFQCQLSTGHLACIYGHSLTSYILLWRAMRRQNSDSYLGRQPFRPCKPRWRCSRHTTLPSSLVEN